MISAKVILPTRGTDDVRRSDAPVLTPDGLALIANALPSGTEPARLNEAYKCCQTTAVASVVAMPTTAAQVSLWNGEPPDGKWYLVQAAHTIGVAGAFVSPLTLVGCINARRVANPAGTLLTIRGTIGQPYLGNGVVALARTITNDGWFPLDSSRVNPAAANAIGTAVTVDLQGAVVLPPGYLFSISVVTINVGVTVRSGLRWQEVVVGV